MAIPKITTDNQLRQTLRESMNDLSDIDDKFVAVLNYIDDVIDSKGYTDYIRKQIEYVHRTLVNLNSRIYDVDLMMFDNESYDRGASKLESRIKRLERLIK